MIVGMRDWSDRVSDGCFLMLPLALLYPSNHLDVFASKPPSADCRLPYVRLR